MKPIRLWMEGIGSYRNKTCIDFSSFYSMGIYLITGDTGAGKTTLFDGMMYALYGKASGSLRTGADLKSDYVQETVRSNVTLEFSHQGAEYTVTRMSAYKRPKKRKVGDDAYVEVSAEAEFVSKEGEVIAGWDKVTQKIVELIGLTDEQFRQTIMLSQGEFAKVLTSDTTERKKIFRSLFHTQLYDAYSYQVKRDVMRAKEDYEKEKIKWMQYVAQLALTDGQNGRYEKLSSCIGQCRENQEKRVTDSAKYWLEQNKYLGAEYELLEKENREQLGQIEEKRRKKAKEKEELQVLETEVKNRENQKAVMKKAVEEKEKLEEQLAGKKQQGEVLVQEEAEVKGFEGEAVLLQNSLPEYEKRELLQKEYIDCRTVIGQLELQERKVQSDEIVVKDNLQKLKKEKEKMQGVNLSSIRIQVQLDKLQSQKALNEETKHLMIAFQKKQIEKKELDEKYGLCTQIYQEEKINYDAEEVKFYHGQAGLLAEKLQDGVPCPVCGSCEHPSPAPSAKALSRQELDERKASVEKRHTEWIQLSKEAGIMKSSLESDWNLICQQLEKVKLIRESAEDDCTVDKLNECTSNVKMPEETDLISVLQSLDSISNQMTERIRQTGSELNSAKEQEARRQLLETQLIPDCEQKLQKLQEELIQVRHDLVAKKTAIKMQEEQIESYNEKLSFKTLEEVSARIGDLQNAVTAWVEKKKLWQQEMDFLSGEIKKKAGIIETAKESLNSKEYPDMVAIKEQLEVLDRELAQLEKAHIEIYEMYVSNQKLWALIEQAYGNAKKAEAEYSTIEGVNRIVNGSLGFENFVQIAFFEQIVKEANVYLGQMTSNQYQFLRTNEGKRQNSQSGLNLLILDRYTGRKRNVTTLSGGELFKASLAMALGLSTMIQGFYGGKKIESMFVDEGFGNLDEKSLEEAVSTLRHLSEKGCLVGIISHVEKLNEWIPARIVVKRNGYEGSSVEIQN